MNPPLSTTLSPTFGAKPGRKRYASLDTIRGGLLVMMAVNHIPFAFSRLTQQPLGFMTAAEGFVFLSGLLVGLVYGRRWLEQGATSTSRLLLRRGAIIYLAHIFCVVAIYFWMFLYYQLTDRLPVGTPWFWFEQPLGAFAATMTLLNQPGLLDVLPTYCGLLLITPLLFWLFARGWLRLGLIVSAIIWLGTNLIDPAQPTIIGVINTGAFNFGAWQFLYTAAVALGYQWANGAIRAWRPGRKWVACAVGGVVVFSWCRHTGATLGLSESAWFILTNKNNLAPLRLLNVAMIVTLFHAYLSWSPRGLVWEPLALLGRHSLVVFSVHCVVALVMLGLPWIFESPKYGMFLGPVMILGIMGYTARLCEGQKKAVEIAKAAMNERTPAAKVLVAGD